VTECRCLRELASGAAARCAARPNRACFNDLVRNDSSPNTSIARAVRSSSANDSARSAAVFRARWRWQRAARRAHDEIRRHPLSSRRFRMHRFARGHPIPDVDGALQVAGRRYWRTAASDRLRSMVACRTCCDFDVAAVSAGTALRLPVSCQWWRPAIGHYGELSIMAVMHRPQL
jgi:hypothetical protein